MSTHRRLDQAGQDRAGKLANLNPGSGKLMQGVADCSQRRTRCLADEEPTHEPMDVWIRLGKSRTWAGRLMHGVVEWCALLVEGEGAWLTKSHNNQCYCTRLFQFL